MSTASLTIGGILYKSLSPWFIQSVAWRWTIRWTCILQVRKTKTIGELQSMLCSLWHSNTSCRCELKSWELAWMKLTTSEKFVSMIVRLWPSMVRQCKPAFIASNSTCTRCKTAWGPVKLQIHCPRSSRRNRHYPPRP